MNVVNLQAWEVIHHQRAAIETQARNIERLKALIAERSGATGSNVVRLYPK